MEPSATPQVPRGVFFLFAFGLGAVVSFGLKALVPACGVSPGLSAGHKRKRRISARRGGRQCRKLMGLRRGKAPGKARR